MGYVFNQGPFRAGLAAATAQALYQDLFDAAPVALLTLDAEGVLAHINHRAAQLLETTVARLTGRRFLQFVAPAGRDDFQRFFHHCLGQQHLQRAPVPLLPEAGTSFTVHLVGGSSRTPSGLLLVRFTLARAGARVPEWNSREAAGGLAHPRRAAPPSEIPGLSRPPPAFRRTLVRELPHQ
ncbi:PAS domain S-box protein [Hymenobacter rubripertinctus]|uniref:PAS domain S-box protein n=1 Tax=Hymenobacter rubripertinctus TaxID=2029981 RepID=UPI001600CBAB|nr:PAS domain-containing protein [Hymenobacter rubripertinctus]